MNKVYLGDGAYAAFDEYGDLVLTTEDGHKSPTNKIHLGDAEWQALVRFVTQTPAKDVRARPGRGIAGIEDIAEETKGFDAVAHAEVMAALTEVDEDAEGDFDPEDEENDEDPDSPCLSDWDRNPTLR